MSIYRKYSEKYWKTHTHTSTKETTRRTTKEKKNLRIALRQPEWSVKNRIWPINVDSNASSDAFAKTISLSEREYHCEDFERNKYQESGKQIQHNNHRLERRIYLLVRLLEQQSLLLREGCAVQTIAMLSEDNHPYKSSAYSTKKENPINVLLRRMPTYCWSF